MMKKEYKRKCVKVIDGRSFLIDKPIKGSKLVTLFNVPKGDKKQYYKLAGMIEGEEVEITPTQS